LRRARRPAREKRTGRPNRDARRCDDRNGARSNLHEQLLGRRWAGLKTRPYTGQNPDQARAMPSIAGDFVGIIAWFPAAALFSNVDLSSG
jgi:hypothetical protein